MTKTGHLLSFFNFVYMFLSNSTHGKHLGSLGSGQDGGHFHRRVNNIWEQCYNQKMEIMDVIAQEYLLTFLTGGSKNFKTHDILKHSRDQIEEFLGHI